MNVVDYIVELINPAAGLRRQTARKFLKRGYEGAGKGRRYKNWNVKQTSSSTLWAKDALTLAERAKDLVRNNGWAKSAKTEYLDTFVGPGLTPKFVQETGVYTDLDRSWKVWSDFKFCDYERTKTFGEMQRLILSTWFVEGECFIRKMVVSDNKYLRDPSLQLSPFAYHIMGPEMLDSKKKAANIKNGIEYENSRPVAYWIFQFNPLEDRQAKSVRIPAEDIIHMNTEKEIGQKRGITDYDASIKPFKEGDEYEDATVINRKLSACLMTYLKGVDYDDETGEATYELPTDMEPGAVVPLPPDVDVETTTPPVVTDFKDVSKSQIYKGSAGLGMSYEGVSKDVSNTNYSSYRGARNSQERTVAAQRAASFIPRFLNIVADDFLLIMNAPTEVNPSWNPPPSLMLDPEKEGNAYNTMVRNGFYTLQDVVEKVGKDPNTHLIEIQKLNEKLDSLGIVLDSDARKTTKSGQFQVAVESGA